MFDRAVVREHRAREYFVRPIDLEIASLVESKTVLSRARQAPPSIANLDRQYERLGLSDVDLGLAGRFEAHMPIHQAIAALKPGSTIEMKLDREKWVLVNSGGVTVGRLAATYSPPPGTESPPPSETPPSGEGQLPPPGAAPDAGSGVTPGPGGCPPSSELLGGKCVHYTATCRQPVGASSPVQSCAGTEEKLVCKPRADGMKDCCCLVYDRL